MGNVSILTDGQTDRLTDEQTDGQTDAQFKNYMLPFRGIKKFWRMFKFSDRRTDAIYLTFDLEG